MELGGNAFGKPHETAKAGSAESLASTLLLPVQVAGEVPDEFDEKKYVEIKDRPHVSRAVPLAVASVGEAVEDAGLDVTPCRATNCAASA